jgi:hypothetical protein
MQHHVTVHVRSAGTCICRLLLSHHTHENVCTKFVWDMHVPRLPVIFRHLHVYITYIFESSSLDMHVPRFSVTFRHLYVSITYILDSSPLWTNPVCAGLCRLLRAWIISRNSTTRKSLRALLPFSHREHIYVCIYIHIYTQRHHTYIATSHTICVFVFIYVYIYIYI